MSVPARITLGVAVAISSAIIGYVHYKQTNDRIKLHDGVLRDVELQKRRQNENTYNLQQQIDMTKNIQHIQGISNDSADPPIPMTTEQPQAQSPNVDPPPNSAQDTDQQQSSTSADVQVPQPTLSQASSRTATKPNTDNINQN